MRPVSVILFLMCAVAGILFAVFEDRRPEQAERLLKIESKTVVKTHGKDYSPPKDPWGTDLQWVFEPDQKMHKGTVISAGPDTEFGTDDDLSHTSTDINKTGIVSEWAGSKVKEATKGFFRGLKKPDQH